MFFRRRPNGNRLIFKLWVETVKDFHRKGEIMKRINTLLLLGILLLPFTSSAQDVVKYPTKPITYIVTYAPGGGADITGRALCKIAEGILGQPIVVENKPGGMGAIGTNLMAKAKPDGYTIGGVSFSALALLPLVREVPYKTKEDFSFICMYADYADAFVVRADAPWKTLKDFIEDARKNPGKLTYTTTGAKGLHHLIIQKVAQVEGVKLRYVPLASDAEMITAVLGGHVDAGFIGAVAPHIKSGALRGLAVDNLKRWDILPNIPTFTELGYQARPPWIGVIGPKGIPEEILQKLEKAFEKATQDVSFHNVLERIYMLPVYRSGGEFKEIVFKDYDTQRDLLKELPLD